MSFSPEIEMVDQTDGRPIWLSTACAKYAWWSDVVPSTAAECAYMAGDWPLFISRGQTLKFLTDKIGGLGRASTRLWGVSLQKPLAGKNQLELPVGVVRLVGADTSDPQLDLCFFGTRHLRPRERPKPDQLERIAQAAVLGGMAAAFTGGLSKLSAEIYGDEVGVGTADLLRTVGFVGAMGLTADCANLAIMSAWSPSAEDGGSEAARVSKEAYARSIGEIGLTQHT